MLGLRGYFPLGLPLYSVVLSRPIMRPSSTLPRASYWTWTYPVFVDGLALESQAVFGDACAGLSTAPPALGEHTDAVLREFGFDPMQIDELRRAGVI